MELKPISQRSKNWHFVPLKAWPEKLPAISWKGEILAGFQSPTGFALDIEGSFTEALKSVHPELSLPELSRLYVLADLGQETWQKALQEYNYRLDASLVKTLKRLPSTPMEFQNWASSRSLGHRELAITTLASDIDPLLLEIARRNLSRNQGAQALEWGIEIFMAEGEVLIDEKLSPENWLAELRKKRFAKSSQLDEKKKSAVRSLPWPLHSKAQWLRQGDRAGIQVQFHAHSQKELERNIQGLKNIESLLAEDPERLWTN